MSTRRSFLRSGVVAAATGALAGCLAAGSPDPTTLSLGERATLDEATPRVDRVHPYAAYVLDESTAPAIRSAPHTQFLLAWVDVRGEREAPPPEQYGLVLDGRAPVPAEAVRPPPEVVYGAGRVVGGDWALVFPVPTTRAVESAAVVRFEAGDPVAEWPVDGATLDLLNDPPAVQVRDVRVPDRVERGEPFPVAVTAARLGGRAEPLAVVATADSLAGRVERVDLPAGRPVRTTLSLTAPAAGTSAVLVEWMGGRIERPLHVEG
ncbi:hypothetical protein [Halomarina ordinaria]|uniref:Twin-arginine translocation signal domain-containing protein n=1 Tax=Halomarina ordinaria TaxID=3033939 RepID=A0ABD5UFC3_9EURY|nr:hypothetical protein [Halomarina sp. PSRA2]